MVIFGHRRGGGPTPKKSRNYLFLGKIFKFQGGSGPPVPPSGSAHVPYTPKICIASYIGLYIGGIKLRKLSQCTLKFKIQWEPWIWILLKMFLRVRSFTGMDRNGHNYRNGHCAMALCALDVVYLHIENVLL